MYVCGHYLEIIYTDYQQITQMTLVLFPISGMII